MKRLIFVCTALALLTVSALAAKDREPGLYATLDTTMGKIVVKLFEKEAPITVKNFVDLATGKKKWRDAKTGKAVSGQPLYDGIMFHRVIPNFMIQTGAHLPDGGARVAENIPDEVESGLKFDRPGRLGMANAGSGTGNSQFFITHAATPWLNGKHTIFGQVVEGQNVVDKIGNLPRDSRDMPRTPVLIEKLTIERVEPAPENKE